MKKKFQKKLIETPQSQKRAWVMIFIAAIFAVLLIVNVSAAWTTGLSKDLISYWKFDETSGTLAEDSHIAGDRWGGTKDLTVASANWVNGKIGNAYNTSGQDNINTYINHTGQGGFTINFWMYKTAVSDSIRYFYTEALTAGLNGEIFGWMDSLDNTKFYIADSGGNHEFYSFVMDVGEWYMVTHIVNLTDTEVFINGTSKATYHTSGFTFGNFDLNLFSFNDGSYKLKDTKIDEMAIWNRTLTSSEVSALWNNGSGVQYYDPLKFSIKSVTYNSTTYETSLESFIVNVSYNNTVYTGISAVLNYNGTDYASTKSSDAGGYAIFTNSLNISVGNLGNKSFYWNFTLTNSTDTVFKISKTYSQTVNMLVFGKCNSTLTIPYINFTFKDESDSSTLNATIDSSTWSYWLTGNAQKTLAYSNPYPNLSYAFCLNVNKTLNANFTIQYARDGYPQRIATNSSIVLTNITTNYTLYLLKSADGIYTTFQVLSQAGQPIKNVYATAERQVSGVWTEVGNGYTGDDGGITFWVNPDYSHRFTFTKSGYETGTVTLTPTQSSYTITLGTAAEAETFDFNRGISYIIKPADYILNNNTYYVFNFTIVSNYWDLEKYGFVLTNGTDSLGSVSGTTGAGGSVTLNISTSQNGTIVMDYYWVITGNYSNASRSWAVGDTTDYGFSLKTFFDRVVTYTKDGIFGLNEFSRTLLIFFFIFVVVGIMSYISGIYSPAAILWEIFVLVALFDYGVGLLPQIGRISYFPTIIIGLVAFGYTLWEVKR